jgi:hypothetical protein
LFRGYKSLGYQEAGVIPGWTIGRDGERYDDVTLYQEIGKLQLNTPARGTATEHYQLGAVGGAAGCRERYQTAVSIRPKPLAAPLSAPSR